MQISQFKLFYKCITFILNNEISTYLDFLNYYNINPDDCHRD